MATKKATTAVPAQSDEERAPTPAEVVFTQDPETAFEKFNFLPPTPVLSLAVATKRIAIGAAALIEVLGREHDELAFRADGDSLHPMLFDLCTQDALHNLLRTSMELLGEKAESTLAWAREHHRKLEGGAA